MIATSPRKYGLSIFRIPQFLHLFIHHLFLQLYHQTVSLIYLVFHFKLNHLFPTSAIVSTDRKHSRMLPNPPSLKPSSTLSTQASSHHCLALMQPLSPSISQRVKLLLLVISTKPGRTFVVRKSTQKLPHPNNQPVVSTRLPLQ